METIRIKTSLFVLLLMLVFSWQTIAQETDKTLSPYFLVVSEDAELDQLPLKATSADVSVSGVIANVRVQQVYSNQGKNPIEAIYVFPSSTRAAVYSMNVRIGERVLTAKIKEKEQARKDYNKAKEEGKSATLLEQERPNVFQMNVANIMPGDTVKVELCYTELLVPNKGEYEFVYPTVVGPRYSNKGGAQENNANNPSNNWVANPYTHQNEKPQYTFDLHLVLMAGMAISEAKCSSHKTNILFDNESVAICQLDAKDQYAGNKDFIFQYRLSDTNVKTGMLLYEGQDENFFLAMIQPPKTVRPEQIPPREYIFIVDVSGSMEGYPLEISKKMMRNLLRSLKPQDRFNILLFAGTSKLFSPTSLEVTEENIDKGIKFTKDQEGSGGTELISALKNAMAIPANENYSRSFVLLTDGYVDVEPESFELVGQNLNKANFFAMGIGSSVNRFLIEGLCRVGKAEPFVVTNQGEADGMASKLMEYIQCPVLTKIKTQFQSIDVYDLEPSAIPDAFVQRPILIYGKWRGKPTGTLTLTGQTGGMIYEEQLKFASFPPKRSNVALKYLWARNKIQTISDYAGPAAGESTKKDVCELGLKYNLLTAYTSFIAVDSIVRNGKKEVNTIKQALPLPENVGDRAVGASNSVRAKRAEAETGIMREDVGSEPSNMSDDQPKIFKHKKGATSAKNKNQGAVVVADELPQYPGGEDSLKAFIQANLKYPEAAKAKKIGGKVQIRFTVTKTGELTNVVVIQSIDPLLDAEALRIVKLMPRWIPGKHHGSPAAMTYTLPIEFQVSE